MVGVAIITLITIMNLIQNKSDDACKNPVHGQKVGSVPSVTGKTFKEARTILACAGFKSVTPVRSDQTDQHEWNNGNGQWLVASQLPWTHDAPFSAEITLGMVWGSGIHNMGQ